MIKKTSQWLHKQVVLSYKYTTNVQYSVFARLHAQGTLQLEIRRAASLFP